MSLNISDNTLQQLGFSPNEATIYTTLLALKKANVASIAKQANLHRRNVYDAINRLIKKGLIFETFQEKEKIYVPIEPERLLDRLKEQEAGLRQLLPYLQQLHASSDLPQTTHVYRGLVGFKNYLQELAQAGNDIYMLGGLAWQNPQTRPILEKTGLLLEKKKKHINVLFDDAVHPSVSTIALKNFAPYYKFFPPQYTAHSSVDACSDYVGGYTVRDITSFDDEAFIFIVKDKRLADSVRAWWQCVWDMLPQEK